MSVEADAGEFRDDELSYMHEATNVEHFLKLESEGWHYVKMDGATVYEQSQEAAPVRAAVTGLLSK